MQPVQNIPIPQRRQATQRQMHSCAHPVPEWYGNMGSLDNPGSCDVFPGEDDFLDFFGLDDPELQGSDPGLPTHIPIHFSPQSPPYITSIYAPNYTYDNQNSGDFATASQLHPIYEDFWERYPSQGSLFSAPSYSSIPEQSSPRTFQSSGNSWTTFNSNSFTPDIFHAELDSGFDSSFPAELPFFNNSDDLATIFGASHWSGLPHTADSHLFDIASDPSQAPIYMAAMRQAEHEADNQSCDLDAEWGSAIGSGDLHDYTLALQQPKWQASAATFSGYEAAIISNHGQDSSWQPPEDFYATNAQNLEFLEEEMANPVFNQLLSNNRPVSSTASFRPTPPEDREHSPPKQELCCQEVTYDCFIIQEDGLGNTKSPPLPHISGQKRERGPLPPDKRKVVREKRRQGTICLRCRVGRVECDGHNPCGRCIRLGTNSLQGTPCIKASFSDIVKSGTCNYISQRNINHFTLDKSRRIKMTLPENFDLSQLLHMLSTRRNRFNIRARQASGSLYILDLNECYAFLRDLQQNYSLEKTSSLRTFIDETLVHTKSWFQCVKECDPKNNKTLLLSQWNNMPSRATYSIIPHQNKSEERPLDPEDEEDKLDILIAAQISRIVCRKLELDGYASLQAEINKMHGSSSSYSSRKATTVKLGKILLTLRWRMSWWQLLGDGSNSDDIFRDRFIYRVEQLCRALYFYYFTLKNKIGSWVGEEMDELRGEWSSYPDSTRVFDDFPTVNSIQGFEEWLERGKALIREANAERKFKNE